MELKFTEYLLCAIISYRYYLIYLQPRSIYGLDITIVQLVKLRHEEVIWFAQSHTVMMTENSIQAPKSRYSNPCFKPKSTISWNTNSSKPKIHLGRHNPDYLGLFLKEIKFRKDWVDFRKIPEDFEDGDLMHLITYSFIQKDLINEDQKEVKVKRQNGKSLFSSCSWYLGIAPQVNRQLWWYSGIRVVIEISKWCWES